MKQGKNICVGMTLALIAVGLVAEASVESAPVLVRSCASARIWQTDFSPTQPLRWCWGRTDAAEVSVVDYGRIRPVAQVHRIVRENDEAFGSFVLPLPKDFASGEERLYDISLTLFKAGVVWSTETARVARVHAVVGEGMSVLQSDDVSWGLQQGNGILAYDSAWGGDGTTEISLVVATDVIRTNQLDGLSGYTFADLGGTDRATVTLRFDEIDYASAELHRFRNGLLLMVR